MIHGAIRFLQVRCAVLSNLEQPGGKGDSAFTADTLQTLPHGFSDASVMLSPVSLASSCASLCASLFLMLRLIETPLYYISLPFHHASERLMQRSALSPGGRKPHNRFPVSPLTYQNMA